MNRDPEPNDLAVRPGCTQTVLGVLLLSLLAPIVALLRTLSRWRRGSSVKITWREERGAEPLIERLWLDLDVPPAHQERARRMLSELMVRSAEGMRCQDDSYHLVYREAGAAEASALPLGPRVQALGERFSLSLGRLAVEECTLLWLVLPVKCPLAAVLDPLRVDPEDPAQLEQLVRAPELRWAVALTHRQAPASRLYRMAFFVPEESKTRVLGWFERLKARLGPT